VSVNNTKLYFIYNKIVYCQGDMFRTLLGHLQGLWENRSKSYLQGGSNMTGTDVARFTHKQSRSYLNHLLYFNALWDPTMHWNIDSSLICFPRWPEDDLIKVETCCPDNILFFFYIDWHVFIPKNLCKWHPVMLSKHNKKGLFSLSTQLY